MKPKYLNLLTLPALFLTAGLSSAATVITEFGTHAGGGIFNFTNVPSNSSLDTANGLSFSVLAGTVNGGIGTAERLTDGVAQTTSNQTGTTFFFSDNNRGRIQVDLGESLSITQINTYSWHQGTRSPQQYRVYGATTVPLTGPNFTAAAFQNDTALGLLGYTPIASVSTTQGGGIRGVSISDIGASYRYIMFDIDTANGTGTSVGTFFGEIDIIAIPEPSAALLGSLGLLALLRRRRA